MFLNTNHLENAKKKGAKAPSRAQLKSSGAACKSN